VQAAVRTSMVRSWVVGIFVLRLVSIRMSIGMVAVEAAADFHMASLSSWTFTYF